MVIQIKKMGLAMGTVLSDKDIVLLSSDTRYHSTIPQLDFAQWEGM